MANPSYINFGKRPISAGGFVAGKYRMNGLRVINKTGSDIAINKLVAVVGFDVTSGLPKVVLADANVATHRDVYVTLQAITSTYEGVVFKGGLSTPVLNTNSVTTVGDPVYLSETAGGFAVAAPGGANVLAVPVGWTTVKSSTIGQIHWDIGSPLATSPNAEVLTATTALTAAQSGGTYFLNAATEFVTTLPVPAIGLRYDFVVTAAPSGASYTVVTAQSGAACEIMIGHILTSGFADSGSDVELTAGGTTLTFVNSVSAIGDRASFVSDGTNWYVSAICAVEAGITITG